MSTITIRHVFPSGACLELALGDLTREHVDAIVNAANDHLQHGGGVAAAIARRGGPLIQRESNRWVREHGPVSHDRPAVTAAGDLPCRYVIHAVGPVWGSGDETTKLAAAVRGSLQTAAELGLTSIALPAISTGIYGFPLPLAAEIILQTITEFTRQNPTIGLRVIRITLWDEDALQVFEKAFQTLFPSPTQLP